MKNKDLEIKEEKEIKNEMKEAIENGDSDGFVAAQAKMAKQIEEKILEEAKEVQNEDLHDKNVMKERGLNPLTAEEREYYNEVIGGEGFAGTGGRPG